MRDSAVYLAYHAEDPTLNREPGKAPISRGVPIEKALDPHTLLAWEMNGVPLPPEHGFPLRLICPGWPGSTSGKWLKRLQVRDRVHDGPKMTGTSYRVPRHPVSPGEKVPEEDFEIIGVMPVKSLITRPAHLFQTLKAEPLEVGGHAWCGEGKVRQVDVTIDYGSTWQRAKLQAPVNPYAWQSWHCALQFPGKVILKSGPGRRMNRGVISPWSFLAGTPKAILTMPCIVSLYRSSECHTFQT